MLLHFKLLWLNRRLQRLIARLQACYQNEYVAYSAKVAAGMSPSGAAAESVDLSVHLRELISDAQCARWDLRFAIRGQGRIPLV